MLKLLSVDEDPASTSEDSRKGDTPSRMGTGRLKSKSCSAMAWFCFPPHMVGTSAKFTKGCGEMNRGVSDCFAGEPSLMVTLVMPFVRVPRSSAEAVSGKVSPWAAAKSMAEVAPVGGFVALQLDQYKHVIDL